MKTIVIALGGNALGKTPEEQQNLIKNTVKKIIPLVNKYKIVITHGNGPQVGIISLAFEDSYNNKEIPVVPLAECTAMSQGYIAYHLEKELRQELLKLNINKEVVSLITQIEVDETDEAFNKRTKPIGLFYTKEQIDELTKLTNNTYVEDAGRGYRKVVSSPKPISILNLKTIKNVLKTNSILITCGGGGIPVIKQDNNIHGVEAVIDKDASSSLLAQKIKADALIILTTVNQVSLNFNKENEIKLDKIDIKKLEEYVKEGHFLPGSMLPKIEASIDFVKSTKKLSIITSLDNLENAISTGKNCTIITK